MASHSDSEHPSRLRQHTGSSQKPSTRYQCSLHSTRSIAKMPWWTHVNAASSASQCQPISLRSTASAIMRSQALTLRTPKKYSMYFSITSKDESKHWIFVQHFKAKVKHILTLVYSIISACKTTSLSLSLDQSISSFSTSNSGQQTT